MPEKYDQLDAEDILMRDLHVNPMFSREKSIQLARQAKAGCIESRNKLITSNLFLVMGIAKKMTKSPRFTAIDLFQEGVFGLFDAIKRFDPDLGFAFTTYASFWIRRRIFDKTRSDGPVCSIPGYLYNANKNGKLSESRTRAFYSALSNPYDISFAPMKDVEAKEDEPLVDLYQEKEEETFPELCYEEDASQDMDRGVLVKKLKQGMKTLSQSRLEVLNERSRGETLKEIGEKRGISKERVRQIEKRALSQLAEYFGLKEAKGTLTLR